MSRFDELVPEHVRALSAYVPGKPVRAAERESGVRCVKLASNENPFGPSPLAVEAMARAAAGSNFYPDNDNLELRLRLAQRAGLAPENVLVTPGSTGFLDIIARTLLRPGLKAVTSERTFIVYAMVVRAAGGTLVQAPMRGHGFDLDAIARSIDSHTRVVFLANPNNPTGTMFDAAAMDAFLERVPAHVLVVLDEAYSDFADDYAARHRRRWSRSLEYVREGRQIVVLRTFSKAHGLAGARVGYGYAPEQVVQHFARVRPAFAVSNVSEAAAVAALEDAEHVRRAVENNVAGVAWLEPRLRELGLQPAPTSANFIYFEVPGPGAAMAKRIQEAGVIVRPLTAWGAPNALRVTVGTPEQNQQFLAALKKALERVPA
ncbi:MAG TPA: histidinol-phosphate transaminase [Terriglobales bacterium]|nr:histidinol-phosphate transaminase [Terriglobales bacterium]